MADTNLAYTEYDDRYRASGGAPRRLGDRWMESAVHAVGGDAALGQFIYCLNRYFEREAPLGAILRGVESDGVRVALIAGANQIDEADAKWLKDGKGKGKAHGESGNIVDFPGAPSNPYLSGGAFTPPDTPDQMQLFSAAVEQFAKEAGMVGFDVRGFVCACEASGWKTTRGVFMTCWRQAAKKFYQYGAKGGTKTELRTEENACALASENEANEGAATEMVCESTNSVPTPDHGPISDCPDLSASSIGVSDSGQPTREFIPAVLSPGANLALLHEAPDSPEDAPPLPGQPAAESAGSMPMVDTPDGLSAASSVSHIGDQILSSPVPSIQYGLDKLDAPLSAARCDLVTKFLDYMDEGLIRYAVDLAVDGSVESPWGYVVGVLRKLKRRGVRTLGAVQRGRRSALPGNPAGADYPQRSEREGVYAADHCAQAVRNLEAMLGDDPDLDFDGTYDEEKDRGV